MLKSPLCISDSEYRMTFNNFIPVKLASLNNLNGFKILFFFLINDNISVSFEHRSQISQSGLT